MGRERATVIHGVNNIRVEEVDRPAAGIGDALIRLMLALWTPPLNVLRTVLLEWIAQMRPAAHHGRSDGM
jgi:hypothetical protein